MGAANLRKILLVEDEDDICVIAKISLENIGHFEVNYAKSGSEALHILDHYTPDLILLDVMMPLMDGVETFHAMRKLKGVESIPIVFMTAKVRPDEIDSYIKLGAAEVICKPFDPLTLANRLRDIWKENDHGK